MRAYLIGISGAAAWAWGTSLVVGLEIASEKGLGAWLIWAAANAGTLAVFGALTRRGFLAGHVFRLRAIKAAALLIQIFCLIIQLIIINKIVLELGGGPIAAYLTATAFGIFFSLLDYRHGLSTGIKTNYIQWLIAIGALLAIIAAALGTGEPRVAFPESEGPALWWGLWAACILFSGPIGDAQHWQRAESAGRGSKAYFIAAGAFGFYMLLIVIAAGFEFSPLMQLFLLVAVLAVTSSTISSISFAVNDLIAKETGAAVALFVCIFWGIFARFDVLAIWSSAGIYRVLFAVLILYLGYRGLRNENRKDETGRFEAIRKKR